MLTEAGTVTIGTRSYGPESPVDASLALGAWILRGCRSRRPRGRICSAAPEPIVLGAIE